MDDSNDMHSPKRGQTDEDDEEDLFSEELYKRALEDAQKEQEKRQAKKTNLALAKKKGDLIEYATNPNTGGKANKKSTINT